MFLTGKIKSLVSTGSPDYTICGQATSILSFVGLNFKLSIGKNGDTTQVLVNTTDLSTVSGLTFSTFTYGNYDIVFNNFVIDTVTSTFQAQIQVYYTGTTDVVTWERFNVFLEISKTGYQSFQNRFEFYNYDVGNSTGATGITDVTSNQDFEIILVDNTNNLDIYGRQTKAASNFITLRRPFTSEIYFYNMIGTQGTISYDTIDGEIGTGNSGKISDVEDLYIEQTIVLPSTLDYCTTGKMTLKSVWFPQFVTSYSSANTCDDCTNNLANTVSSFYQDATDVTVYNIEANPHFLSEFMVQTIITKILNYKSEVLTSDTQTPVLTYSAWILDNTAFLTPVDFTFVPSEIGNNVINITNLYSYSTINLYQCVTNYLLKTCNWWTIEANEKCSSYKISNCDSVNLIKVDIQLLNENKVFDTLSTSTINSLSTLDIDFSTDGIYMIRIYQLDSDTVIYEKFYSLPIFCSLQTCMLNYLNKVLCKPINSTNCNEESHYNFNALMANAHTYFLLLNQELNNNYIYNTISADKVNELYTLKTFVDRFAEYCESSETPCIPCNE